MLWLIIGRTISISINNDHDFKIFHSKFLKKIFLKPDNVNSLRTIMLELRTAIRVKMFTNHQEKLKKYSIFTIQNICRYHWSSTKICSLLILQANSELLLLTTKSINQLTEHLRLMISSSTSIHLRNWREFNEIRKAILCMCRYVTRPYVCNKCTAHLIHTNLHTRRTAYSRYGTTSTRNTRSVVRIQSRTLHA